MSEQVIFNSTDATDAGGTIQLSGFGNRIWGGNWLSSIVAAAGQIKDFHGELSAAPGGGNTRTIKLRKNGADQISLAFGATDTQLSGAGPITYAAGDVVDVEQTSTGSPTASYLRFSYIWVPTTADYTLLHGHTDTTQLSTAATQYLPLTGAQSAPWSGSAFHDFYVATPGTLRSLYIKLSAAPGLSKSRTFTVMKNGAATGITVTISFLGTTGNDTVNTVTVADGDYISLRCVTNKTSPAAAYISAGLVFVPDQPGEFLVGNSGEIFLPTGSATRFRQAQTAGDAWGSTQAATESVAPKAMQLKRLRVHVDNTPASPGQWFLFHISSLTNYPNCTINSTSGADVVSERPRNIKEWQSVWAVAASSNIAASPPDDRTSASMCLVCRSIPNYGFASLF